MKWLEIKAGFESNDNIFVIDLVSSIFYDLGAQGVLIEDSDTEIEEHSEEEIRKPPKYNAVVGYLPIDKSLDKKFKIFKKKLEHLKKEVKIKVLVSCREIDEEDWAESWKSYFWPEKITGQIAVKPTWRKYEADPEETVIEIDPGMAFGTGTHPTTRLCIILIEKYLKPGQSLLDIGTGTGILLIAAAKLGAEKGLGIDHDEIAVDIGRENLRLNRLEPEKFKIKAGNLSENAEGFYDVVVANILSDVIICLLSSVDKVLKSNGLFICSGISVINKNKVLERMKEKGFEIVEVCVKDEWAAIVGRFMDKIK
ncbi:MAG: 50S ribosomal protein L11 methyltransferase [bacterium]